MSEPNPDPPALVTDRFQLGFLDFLFAFLRWPWPLVLVAFLAIVAFGAGPATAAKAAVVLVLLIVMRSATQPAVARLPRSLAVWSDGRYQARTGDSVYDNHLGRAQRIDRGVRSWRIQASPNMVVFVPHRAFTAEQSAIMAGLVSERRSPGASTQEYPSDWWSTLPYQFTLGEVLASTARRLGPIYLPLAALLGAVIGTSTGSMAQGIATGAIAFVVWGSLIVISIARSLRAPSAQGRRVALRWDGLEIQSAAGSSVIQPDLIHNVKATRSAIEFTVGRPFFIPIRAFRDEEHRRSFEAGLRRLAEET